MQSSDDCSEVTYMLCHRESEMTESSLTVLEVMTSVTSVQREADLRLILIPLICSGGSVKASVGYAVGSANQLKAYAPLGCGVVKYRETCRYAITKTAQWHIAAAYPAAAIQMIPALRESVAVTRYSMPSA